MKDTTKNSKPLAPVSAKKTGVDFKDASSSPEKGTLVKKKNTQAGDPTIKDAAVRKNVVSADAGHAGARYGVRVKFQKQEAPEAGATQANGRLLPAAIKRQAPSFSAGAQDHN
jgi:hypothetical protein